MLNTLTYRREFAPEYTVYTYRKPESPHGTGLGNKSKRICWDRFCANRERKEALVQAKDLFETGLYQKVEVKKTFHCPSTKKAAFETVKIFSENQNYKTMITMAALAWSTMLTVLTVMAYLNL